MPSHAVLNTPPQAGSAFSAGIDPVRFEALRNALLAITAEMGPDTYRVDDAATTTLRAGMVHA